MASYSSTLSLGAKNSIVAYFKDLVDKASLSETEKAANNVLSRFESSKLVSFIQTTARDIYSSVTKNTSQKRKIAEFTQELYDKAINLPEAQSVTFEYVTTIANYKHGLFKGGNIYRDYNGTLESTDNAEKLGWIYIDNTNSEYCLFTRDNNSFIIALSDFEPKPIVADFYPLYEKLQASQYSKADSIVDDIFTALSLISSYRAVLSGAMSNLYAAKSLLMNEYYNPISSFIESFDGKMIGADLPNLDTPNWLKRTTPSNEFQNDYSSSLLSNTKKKVNKVVYNNDADNTDNTESQSIKNKKWNAPLIRPDRVLPNYEIKNVRTTSLLGDRLSEFDLTLVQAVIYDSPNDTGNIRNVLCCYQQPDTISYTASSQFDSPQPRGSQIPFNFYQCANAMTLNFTLKWHIDEVRYMCLDVGNEKNEKVREKNRMPCLQDVADLAERFTRPVRIARNSILPRTVFVILPGITRRGYMTEAQVSLSGDLAGSKIEIEHRGIKVDRNNIAKIEYQYTQIEIAFSLLITNDVTLHRQDAAGSFLCSLYDEDNKKYSKDNINTDQDVAAAEQDTKDAEETAKEKSEEDKNSIEEKNQALIDAANADAKAEQTGDHKDKQKAEDAKKNASNKTKKADEAKKAKKAADKAEKKAREAEEKAKKAKDRVDKAKAKVDAISSGTDQRVKNEALREQNRALQEYTDANKEVVKASAAAKKAKENYNKLVAAKTKTGNNKMTP